MNNINYRLLVTIIGIAVLILVVYPLVGLVFLDIGLNLHLGIGRVYAIWSGVFLLIGTLCIVVYLLWPDTRQRQQPGQWRQR